MKTLDVMVTLRSGVRVRAQLTAYESQDPHFFDEDTAVARAPDYLDTLEVGELLSAGAAEKWHGPKDIADPVNGDPPPTHTQGGSHL